MAITAPTIGVKRTTTIATGIAMVEIAATTGVTTDTTRGAIAEPIATDTEAEIAGDTTTAPRERAQGAAISTGVIGCEWTALALQPAPWTAETCGAARGRTR